MDPESIHVKMDIIVWNTGIQIELGESVFG